MAGPWMPLVLVVACIAAPCAGAGRSLADIFNAFRRAAADCVGQALAAGARTRHSAAMMIGAILVISRWLLIGFLLLRCSSSSQAAQVRFQSSHSLRARRN